MTDQPGALAPLTRRSALVAAGTCFAMASQQASAAQRLLDKGVPTVSRKPTYAKMSEADGMREIVGLHDGSGTSKIRFFGFDGAPAPAHFIIYDLPPGASEGTHTHYLDDRNKEGSFDEYYYIISGQGRMEIDGEQVPVVKGDHVHTPLEVSHGIENTHATEHLRVFLTFIRRGTEQPSARMKAAHSER
ncbi:cupin domain-containing protein [Sphingomonas sp. MG17]|uniref:Cupin domain-containing protein n=1 Tax=Sphingomonas tagetis TaxID=2949092 RepID=A0A9X2HSL8_9SPHN|nr:cupin domain-containing protein [Sphingomonas tagetis]MCP3732738.1 cupin domain-containing protein [Sphingomonas tagetis]